MIASYTSSTSRLRSRLTFTALVVLYGAALSSAAVIISFIVRTDRPRVPSHLGATEAIFFSLAATVAAAILIAPVVYRMSRLGEDHPWYVWAGFGFAFWLLIPFLTGLLLLPTAVIMDLTLSLTDESHAPVTAGINAADQVMTAVARAPRYSFIHLGNSVLTTMVGGAVFAVGGYMLDWLNSSSKGVAFSLGSWALALAIGSGFLILATLAPPDTLNKLG